MCFFEDKILSIWQEYQCDSVSKSSCPTVTIGKVIKTLPLLRFE